MADSKKPTGMLMDGVFSSEAIDSSGEVVSLKGMDTSYMEEGYGVANYEHLDEDKGGFGREVVGKIVYVHKVFKESDCENDRQRQYWSELKGIPFLYGIVRLYDGAGHEGAKALAAQVRDAEANGEPIIVRYSIEGTTLKKDGNHIKESIAKRVALTLKPCNKTCVSGVLADPNKPEGFGKSAPAEAGFDRLGVGIEIECRPLMKDDSDPYAAALAAGLTAEMLSKAIEAGMLGGAPSTLTGGAALQREHLAGHLENQAKATLRDWGRRRFDKGEFIAFAKARMPEVSDEFLDHFADAAEHVTLRKKEGDAPVAGAKRARAPRAAKPAAPHPVLEEISDAHEHLPDELVPDAKKPSGVRSMANGTVRGQPLQPNPGIIRPTFDPQAGILHTPVGSFHAYLPQHDGPASAQEYQRILSHPNVENAMDHALTNWVKVHKLLKAGKLPPEVVMHAVLFSQLSPTKPVPVQEIQFARLHDAMRATGIDPRSPGFASIMPHWQGLDSPTELPQTSRDTFAANKAYYMGQQIGPKYKPDGTRVGKPSETTGRMPGDLVSVSPLAKDFMKRADQYHSVHPMLMDLVGRHRHDMLSGTSELMNNKAEAARWESTRRNAIKAGKPDPGEFSGEAVPGLKVKTGLYTWGMMGGGNSLVPDTHEVRHLFGLDLKKDKDTIEYLKQMLWRPTNVEPVMRPLNQWYLNNHPAVQYTLQHPKWGKEFEKPEDSLFPSFWRHWLTIAPHEKFLGLPNLTQQSGTTHAPYWDSIAPHVDPLLKGGDDDTDTSVPMRTALVHQQYVKDYGEIPAQMMYYRFLVPKLLEAAEHRERFGNDMEFLAKSREIEAGIIELRKSIRQVLEGQVPHPAVHLVQLKHGDHAHPAGRYMVHDGKVTHLEDYHGILHGLVPEGPITEVTASRLHGLEFAPHIIIAPHEAPMAMAPPKPDAAVNAIVAPAPEAQRPPVFEYHRAGMATPHVVEFGEHGAAIDGRKLEPRELDLIMHNVETGVATMRYKAGAAAAVRPGGMSDDDLGDLRKDESDVVPHDPNQQMLPGVPERALHGPDIGPADALAQIRAAVAAGHVHPDVERALTRHIYTDPMVADVGNKYAWQQFHAQQRPGVYASIDLNDFKHVNDAHGHLAGDDAIRAAGAALRDAAAKVGTGKLFRPGGDEFVAHFPTMEEASRFVRHARTNFDALPPVKGVHKQSFSMGLGSDFQSADAVALKAAKARKMDPRTGARAFAPGRVPHLVHSVVPGAEGALALHDERPPRQHLPTGTPAAA
jgi:GGDEF domain-containing protein